VERGRHMMWTVIRPTTYAGGFQSASLSPSLYTIDTIRKFVTLRFSRRSSGFIHRPVNLWVVSSERL
jgi:hypothetical protein